MLSEYFSMPKNVKYNKKMVKDNIVKKDFFLKAMEDVSTYSSPKHTIELREIIPQISIISSNYSLLTA